MKISVRAKLLYLNDAMQQGYANTDKHNIRDKEFDRLRTRDCHLELEGRRTGDIVEVGELQWEE